MDELGNSIYLLAATIFVVAVVVSGAPGSYLGASRYSSKVIEKILGAIIVLAVILLGKQLVF